jgi:hypothetical protein
VGGSSVKRIPQTLFLISSITGDSRQSIWEKYAWLLHAIAYVGHSLCPTYAIAIRPKDEVRAEAMFE